MIVYLFVHSFSHFKPFTNTYMPKKLILTSATHSARKVHRFIQENLQAKAGVKAKASGPLQAMTCHGYHQIQVWKQVQFFFFFIFTGSQLLRVRRCGTGCLMPIQE